MEQLDPEAEAVAQTLANARRWQTIWPQVIAHAWADRTFKERLLDPNADLHALFQEVFKYPLSPELKLIIEEASTGTYNPNAEAGKDRWKGLPRMVLKLYIPPPPPVEHRAVAVTHYSETGRTYPMTSG